MFQLHKGEMVAADTAAIEYLPIDSSFVRGEVLATRPTPRGILVADHHQNLQRNPLALSRSNDSSRSNFVIQMVDLFVGIAGANGTKEGNK